MTVQPPPNVDPMDLLQAGAAALGLELSAAVLAQFGFYLTQLKLWNARVNLTGLKTDRDLVVKHFLDSLAVLPFLGEPHSLADLGAGPGFPGLALKLVRPELKLTLVEARAKEGGLPGVYLVLPEAAGRHRGPHPSDRDRGPQVGSPLRGGGLPGRL